MRRFTRVVGALAALAWLVTAGAAGAQEFPNKTIRIISWSSVGGGGDVFARQLAEPLSRVAKVPVVVVNRPGGGGAVAMEYTASQPADGYTLLVATASGVVTPHVAGSRLSVADFKAVSRVQTEPEVIGVRADSPWKSVLDLVRDAKAKPGSIKLGGAFLGTLDSLVAYQVLTLNGLPFEYVPFDGGGEVMTALLGGHVQAILGNPSEMAGQVDAGKVRLIGAASLERVEAFPDVPTLLEQGMEIVGEQWRGIVAPKDTPDEIVQKLDALVREAIEDPGFQKWQRDARMSPGYQGPAQYQRTIAREFKLYGELVAKMGVRKK